MHDALASNLDDVKTECTARSVSKLWAFGSVADAERFTADSDIDLFVSIKEPDPFLWTDQFEQLELALRRILQREVQLVPVTRLMLPSVQETLASAILIYES